MPALITCNHVINEFFLEREKKITISISNRYKNIELDERIKYTNKIYDITIIELKEQDGINSFLDFDDIFYDNDKISSINKSIYTLHYSKNKNIEVSYGIILDEENYFRFNHSCSTGKGSAGAPILDLSTHKVISIHVGGNKDKDCNIGSFLKHAIYELDKQNINNESNMKLLKYNQKYSYFISDLNITSLRLDWMTDERLKDLCELDFKNLRELIFGVCSLKSIKILGNTKFENL